MDNLTPDYYSSVSECLSSLLDKIGYSHKDRDRKVRIADESVVFLNMTYAFSKSKISYYMFGSRAEGSTGPGFHSDRDALFQHDCVKIRTDLSECQAAEHNLLMVQDDHTHPGYIKLQLVDILDHKVVPRYCHQTFGYRLDSYGRTVLLNSSFSSIYRRIRMDDKTGRSPDYVIVGPALRNLNTHKLNSTDIVHAFRSFTWPNEGNHWFLHNRPYGWPTVHHVESARKYGFFATPIGHPNSDEQDLEWRLSFSITERELVRSFEDTIMKVYLLLKMVKKTYIEPTLGDAFSSYHCKVCMLWMRERIPCEFWRTDNLLYCLSRCIRQLFEWASSGYCPDYFIIENNIYDRNIVGETRVKLCMILGNLLAGSFEFLLGIETCDIGQLLTNGLTRIDDMRLRTVTEELVLELNWDYKLLASSAYICRSEIMRNIAQDKNLLTKYLRRILHAIKHTSNVMRTPLNNILNIICSTLGFYIASVCKKSAVALSEQERGRLLKLASVCLSLGINSDATSVRLKMCGLGLTLGSFDLTTVCLQNILDNRMRFMYSFTVDDDNFFTVLDCNIPSILEELTYKRYSTDELLQSQVSASVVYLKSEISITPTVLRMEMFRSIGAMTGLEFQQLWYEWAVVDSLFCAYFLQYLNFSRQGKDRHKNAAMDNMMHVIMTEPRIQHRDTALNLLGYCLMQENLLRDAYKCFTESLRIRPYHNAARFYVGLLFQKAVVARGILAINRN